MKTEMRSLDELEQVMENEKVEIELDLLMKSMKTLELASSVTSGTEQSEIFEEYATHLYDLLMTKIDDQELSDMEDSEMFEL